MTRERTFRTSLLWHDGTGGEIEAEVNVTYVYRAGYAGDRTDPPEDASVEITRIFPLDSETSVPERFLTDDELIAECFEHDADAAAAAEEYRAEQRRDDSLQDWLA